MIYYLVETPTRYLFCKTLDKLKAHEYSSQLIQVNLENKNLYTQDGMPCFLKENYAIEMILRYFP